jgi:hypothetical protein
VRRIAHIEIMLAERGKSGEGLATVVGEETSGCAPSPGQGKGQSQRRAKKKASAKSGCEVEGFKFQGFKERGLRFSETLQP